MNEFFKKELHEAKTLKEVFDVVNKYYDTEGLMGFMTRAAITSNINKLLTASGIKPKK